MRNQHQNGWKSRRLGDLLRIKHGFAFKGEFFAKEGDLVVLTPGNFRADGGLKLEGEQKYYQGGFPQEFLLKRGDLLVVMTDLTQNAPILGSPAFIPGHGKYLHNQRLGKIIDVKEEEIDRSFLFYLLNTRDVRSQIKGSASGATVRHTSPDRMYAVGVCIPPVHAQRKIAAILSAYDDFIENNTRRIKILEKMARAVYQEWFVEFRAPGVKLRKATAAEKKATGREVFPEQWELRKLGDLADVNALSIGKENTPETINYVDISAVSPGRIDNVVPMAFSEAPGRARRIVRHGDVVWSCVRPNRRSYSLILNPLPNLIVSTGFAVITTRQVPYSYLYEAVTTDEFVGYLTNHATGAAYPAVKAEDFESAPVVLPAQNVVVAFQETTEPMFEVSEKLRRENDNLAHTRDLLLPRLMSGEVGVEGLEIARTEGAARELAEMNK